LIESSIWNASELSCTIRNEKRKKSTSTISNNPIHIPMSIKPIFWQKSTLSLLDATSDMKNLKALMSISANSNKHQVRKTKRQLSFHTNISKNISTTQNGLAISKLPTSRKKTKSL
jgi:hypothetical protein